LERLLFITLLGIAAIAIADGPGSRIGTNAEPPRPGVSPAPGRDMQQDMPQDMPRCESMRGEQKERCLRAVPKNPSPDRPGPEASGGGSNAGTGASSGTSGASSAVGGAR